MATDRTLVDFPFTQAWSAWRCARSEMLSTIAEDNGQLFREFSRRYNALKAQPHQQRRSLQRSLRLSLGGVALALALGSVNARAAVIEVGQDCSLMQAIISANGDLAEGGCTAGSGADTLVLPQDAVFTYTEPSNEDTALPYVSSKIVIEGNNATIERSSASGTPDFRLMRVLGTGDLTLRNSKLSGGSLPAGEGGAILTGGSLTVIESELSGNTAGRGGAISDRATTGALQLRDSVISDNHGSVASVFVDKYRQNDVSVPVRITNSVISGGSADGVFVQKGELLMIDSVVSGNTGVGVNVHSGYTIYGPYYYYFYADATISGSTISGNGSGVETDYYAGATITDSTISGNTGAGVVAAPGDGNSVVVANSTVSGNGGVGVVAQPNYASMVRLVDSTVTGNARGVRASMRAYTSDNVVTIDRSIISGNQGLDIDLAADSDSAPERFATRYSLLGDSSKTRAEAFPNVMPDSTNITATSDGNLPTALSSILDSQLADNGGPTLSHALIEGSPAIDALPQGETCPSQDQRGFVRPVDGDGNGVAQCDLGALEFAGLVIVDVFTPVRSRLQDNLIDGDTTTFWNNDGDLSTAYFEVSISGAAPIGAVQLSTRPNRSYRLNVYVDGNSVGQYVTESRPDASFQRLALPPGTVGTTVRIESAKSKFIRIHEVALDGLAQPSSSMATIINAEVPVKGVLKDNLFDGDLTTYWRNDGDPATRYFELILSDVTEITQFRLAPRTRRDYRFNLYVDDQFVGEYTTERRPTVELQTFDLPAGVMGSRLKVELLNRLKFVVYETEVVVAE